MKFSMRDNTIYIDAEQLMMRNFLRTNSILIVAIYDYELPLKAILQYEGSDYEIKQHTTQYETRTRSTLHIYVCENVHG